MIRNNILFLGCSSECSALLQWRIQGERVQRVRSNPPPRPLFDTFYANEIIWSKSDQIISFSWDILEK